MSGYAYENRGERCDHCGHLLFGRARRRRPTRYCSHICSARAGAAQRRGQPAGPRGPKADTSSRLEDLRWMLQTGESLPMICHRLGVTPHALARWLGRHGQPDLARLFYGLDKHQHEYQAAA